jgi:uncharacterized MAPEG superfamily protein
MPEAQAAEIHLTVELTMLALSVALLFVLIFIQSSAGTLAQGAQVMAGHRDDMKPPTAWQARTKRLVDNHREGLALFTPLVLIAAVADVSTSMTVLGAQLFFYSRVAHAIIYLAGWPWIRPVAWLIGIVGTVMIFAALASRLALPV